MFGEFDDAAELQGIDAFFQLASCLQTDFPVECERNKNADCNKAESADLDQGKKDKLSEKCPVGKSVHKDQSGYAGSTGSRKQCSQKIRTFATFRGTWKHEQTRTDQYQQKKSESDHLHAGKPAFKFCKHRNT